MYSSAAYLPTAGGKRRRVRGPATAGDDGPAGRRGDEDEGDGTISLPFSLPFGKMLSQTTVYSNNNEIHFSDDITAESCFALNRELRQTEIRLKLIATTLGLASPQPIYLFLNTGGGDIHAAFTVVDTIKSLSVPVHTIVSGFVASAGTLISLAGAARYMTKNSYMLIHQLASSCWGKMSNIEDEFKNLKTLMDHITRYYLDNTRIKKKALDRILKQDLIWSLDECVERGLVDGEWTPGLTL